MGLMLQFRAHRTNIVRSLKGLEGIIQLAVMDFELTPNGWMFTGRDGSDEKDPVYGFKYIRELYWKADPNYKLRCKDRISSNGPLYRLYVPSGLYQNAYRLQTLFLACGIRRRKQWLATRAARSLGCFTRPLTTCCLQSDEKSTSQVAACSHQTCRKTLKP